LAAVQKSGSRIHLRRTLATDLTFVPICQVASIAAGFHNLRILSISGCAEVDDEGLIALGLWADELTEINLGNLPKVCLRM
jgi:hypothetical protein